MLLDGLLELRVGAEVEPSMLSLAELSRDPDMESSMSGEVSGIALAGLEPVGLL